MSAVAFWIIVNTFHIVTSYHFQHQFTDTVLCLDICLGNLDMVSFFWPLSDPIHLGPGRQ